MLIFISFKKRVHFSLRFKLLLYDRHDRINFVTLLGIASLVYMRKIIGMNFLAENPFRVFYKSQMMRRHVYVKKYKSLGVTKVAQDL